MFNMRTPFLTNQQLSLGALNTLLPPGTTLLPPGLFAAGPFGLAASINPAVVPGISFLLMNGVLPRATSQFLALSGLSGPTPFGAIGAFDLLPSASFSSVGLTASTMPAGFTTIPLSAVGNSQTAASATTVLSGSELNVVLDDLKQLNAKGLRGREVELPQAVLEHINIVPNSSPGNAGMLKNFGRDWPEMLKVSEFQQEREQIEALLPKLAEQAKAGQVNAADLQNLIDVKEAIQARLAAQIQEAPAPKYIRAKRFLDDLQSSIRVLRQPDTARYFAPANTPAAKTVRELAQYMIKRDLRFAPAVSGDEAAYFKFYQALATYDVVANRAANGDDLAMKSN
jgi:hypothetical protein